MGGWKGPSQNGTIEEKGIGLEQDIRGCIFKNYVQGEKLFLPPSLPSFLLSFLPSLKNYLLGPYTVPGTLVGTGGIAVNKIVPSLMELIF